MGHAAHFLTRIERLNAKQADVALALYRDRTLVRYILDRVELPGGAERVALALEHANSPHIIVTREGRFVTCLGAGMTTGGTPVVSRAQLDQLDERFEFVRVGLRQAERVQESRQLMHRMLGGGSTLSREDFAALRSLMPLFPDTMLEVASMNAKSIGKLQESYRSSRFRRDTPQAQKILHAHWYNLWSLGHEVALCGSYCHDLPLSKPEARERYLRALWALTWVAASTMAPFVVVRAVWAASRFGSKFVPDFAELLDGATVVSTLLPTLLPLVAVALRDSDARDEVRRILTRNLLRFEKDRKLTGVDGDICYWMVGYCSLMLASKKDDTYVDLLRQNGAAQISLRGASLPAGHPQRWDRPEDVPEALALSAVGYLEHSLLASGTQRDFVMQALPWIAHASADDLYVPDQYIDAYGNTFEAEHTGQMLELNAQYHRFGQPKRASAKPGRNEPCTCGSGKKYKRCCGAAA